MSVFINDFDATALQVQDLDLNIDNNNYTFHGKYTSKLSEYAKMSIVLLYNQHYIEISTAYAPYKMQPKEVVRPACKIQQSQAYVLLHLTSY